MSNEKTLRAFMSLLSAEKNYGALLQDKPGGKSINSRYALARFLKTFASSENVNFIVPSLSVTSSEEETPPHCDDLRLLVNDIIADVKSAGCNQCTNTNDPTQYNGAEMHRNFTRSIIFSSGDRASGHLPPWRDASTIPDILNEHLASSMRYILDARLKYFISKLVRKQIRRHMNVTKPVAQILALQVKIDAPSEMDDQTLISPFVENWQPSNVPTVNEMNKNDNQHAVDKLSSPSKSVHNESDNHAEYDKEKEGPSADDDDVPFDINERIRRFSARIGSCATSFKILKHEKPLPQVQEHIDETNAHSPSMKSDNLSNTRSILSIPFTLTLTANFHVSVQHGHKINISVDTKGTIVGKFKDELMEEIELKIDTQHFLDDIVENVKTALMKAVGVLVARLSMDSKKSMDTLKSKKVHDEKETETLPKKQKHDGPYVTNHESNYLYRSVPSNLAYAQMYHGSNSMGIRYPYQTNNEYIGHPPQLTAMERSWYRQSMGETYLPGFNYRNGFGFPSPSMVTGPSAYSVAGRYHGGYPVCDQASARKNYYYDSYRARPIGSTVPEILTTRHNYSNPQQPLHYSIYGGDRISDTNLNQTGLADDGTFPRPERRRSKVEFADNSLDMARMREEKESNNASSNRPMMRRRSTLTADDRVHSAIDSMEPSMPASCNLPNYPDLSTPDHAIGHRSLDRSMRYTADTPHMKIDERLDKSVNRPKSIYFGPSLHNGPLHQFNVPSQETIGNSMSKHSDTHEELSWNSGYMAQSDLKRKRYDEPVDRRNSRDAYLFQRNSHERAYISETNQSRKPYAEFMERQSVRRKSEHDIQEGRNSVHAYKPMSWADHSRINNRSPNSGTKNSRYASIDVAPSIISSNDSVAMSKEEHNVPNNKSNISQLDPSTEILNKSENGMVARRRSSFPIESVLAAVELARMSEADSQAGSEVSTPSEMIRRRSSSAAYAHLVRLLEEEERSKGADSEISMSTVAELGRFIELEEIIRRASAPAMMSAAEAVQRWDRDYPIDRRESEISISLSDASEFARFSALTERARRGSFGARNY